MVPGDPERKARADRMANGMPLSAETWDNILASGDLLGLSREELLKLV
jgi:LDH2 family malate/lactate/ureidoglycolate dehydrogenase